MNENEADQARCYAETDDENYLVLSSLTSVTFFYLFRDSLFRPLPGLSYDASYFLLVLLFCGKDLFLIFFRSPRLGTFLAVDAVLFGAYAAFSYYDGPIWLWARCFIAAAYIVWAGVLLIRTLRGKCFWKAFRDSLPFLRGEVLASVILPTALILWQLFGGSMSSAPPPEMSAHTLPTAQELLRKDTTRPEALAMLQAIADNEADEGVEIKVIACYMDSDSFMSLDPLRPVIRINAEAMDSSPLDGSLLSGVIRFSYTINQREAMMRTDLMLKLGLPVSAAELEQAYRYAEMPPHEEKVDGELYASIRKRFYLQPEEFM